MGKRKSGFKIGQAAVLLLLFLLVMGNIHPYVLHADPPAQIEGEWIQSLDGRWWYRHWDGSYTANAWEYINGYWYHFDSDGWMQTEWLQVNSTWYYLGNNGAMRIGWQYINNYWYYFSSSGSMCTGWVKVNNLWYYLYPNGKMCIGWEYINGAWYYFNTSGDMRTDDLFASSRYYKFYPSGQLKSTRIVISRHEQQNDNWCWAACAVMVGTYESNLPITQSDVVLYVKGRLGDFPALVSETKEALEYASGFSVTSHSTVANSYYFPYSAAASEIDNNRMFIMILDWDNSLIGGHNVVGAGYNHENNSIYVIDPAEDCPSHFYQYDLMVNGMKFESGTGSWWKVVYYERNE